MNTLLIFFALPIAIIIISIVLQKILKCPFLVAGVIFAILLIVAFAVFDATFLIFVIAYTILSFIVAYLTMLICEFAHNNRCCCNNKCNCNNNCSCQDRNTELLTISSNCQDTENGNLLTISSNCSNGNTNDLLTINTNGCNNGLNNNSCNNSNGIVANANIIPNTFNNSNTGIGCGCCRR